MNVWTSATAGKCQTMETRCADRATPNVPGVRPGFFSADPPGVYVWPPSATEMSSIDSPVRKGMSR